LAVGSAFRASQPIPKTLVIRSAFRQNSGSRSAWTRNAKCGSVTKGTEPEPACPKPDFVEGSLDRYPALARTLTKQSDSWRLIWKDKQARTLLDRCVSSGNVGNRE